MAHGDRIWIFVGNVFVVFIRSAFELAAELYERDIARSAYDALLPYAELPMMGSLAIVCFGSAHRPLALVALTCGEGDLAIAHFSAAIAANERLGHRPAAIQARAELALALLHQSEIDEPRRGQALIEEALTEANALGMTALALRWRERLIAVAPFPLQREAGCQMVSVSLTPQGKWRVVFGHEVVTVPDLVGMRYLARLVTEPDRDIPAVAVVGRHLAARVKTGTVCCYRAPY